MDKEQPSTSATSSHGNGQSFTGSIEHLLAQICPSSTYSDGTKIDLKTTSNDPSSSSNITPIYQKPDMKRRQRLLDVGILDSLEWILSMDSLEFRKYNSPQNFNPEQRKVLSTLRKNDLVMKKAHKSMPLEPEIPGRQNSEEPPNDQEPKGMTTLVYRGPDLKRRQRLSDAGIKESLEFILEMDSNTFRKYRNSRMFNTEQKKVLSTIRKNAKEIKYKVAKQNISMTSEDSMDQIDNIVKIEPLEESDDFQEDSSQMASESSRLDESSFVCDESEDHKMQKVSNGETSRKDSASPDQSSAHKKLYQARRQELLKAGISESLDYILSLDRMAFIKFRNLPKFNSEQRDVIFQTRRRILALKGSKKKNPSLPPKKTPKQDTSHISKIFEDRLKLSGIKISLNTLRHISTKEFEDYLKRNGFNEAQEMLLMTVWEHIQKEKGVHDNHPVGPIVKMEPQDEEDASNPIIYSHFSEESLSTPVKIEPSDMPSDDLTSSDHPPNIPVQIENPLSDDKFFELESIAYPGHSYIYGFSYTLPETSQNANTVEVYQCTGCIEVAHSYETQEARKLALEHLKTIKVSNGRIVNGHYDEPGHICASSELMKERHWF